MIALTGEVPDLSPPAIALTAGSSAVTPIPSANPASTRLNSTAKGRVSSAVKNMRKTCFMRGELYFDWRIASSLGSDGEGDDEGHCLPGSCAQPAPALVPLEARIDARGQGGGDR